MTYPKIPSIEQIKAAVKVVRNTNFDNFSLEQMNKFFFKNFGQFAFPSIEILASDFSKLPIYRVRDAKGFNEEKEKDPQRYSFPPNPKVQCTDVGRANWVGKSVFYGSLGTYSAISEIKELYNGREVYISKWYFDFTELGEEYVRVTPMFLGIQGDDVNWSSFFLKNNFEERLISDLGKLGAKRMIYFIQEMCKLFAQRGDSLYKFTAYIANQTIYSSLNEPNKLFFPILIYPSVENKNNSLNYAIHPLFALAYLKLETVFHVQTTELGKASISTALIKIGFLKGDEIKWSLFQEMESKRQFYLDKVQCGCGKTLEGEGFESKILFNGSNENMEQEVVKSMVHDLDREMGSDEFKSKFLNELEIPGIVEYKFYSNFNNKFSFIDENGDEHKQLMFHGGKILRFQLVPLQE